MLESIKGKSSYLQKLKTQAREIAAYVPERLSGSGLDHLSKLLKTLQVYQIELEMQNDELLNAIQTSEDSKKDLIRLYESAPVGYACLSEDGRIVRANQQLSELFGCDYQDMINSFFFNYIAGEDRKVFSARYKALFKHPDDKKISFKVHDQNRHVSLTAKRFQLSAELNSDPLILVAVLDVTTMKRSESELRLAGKVFNNSNEGIVVVDHNGQIIKANRSFYKLTGYSTAEIIGRSPGIFKSDHYGEDFYHSIWQSVKQTGQWQGEVWSRKKSEDIVAYWVSISTIKNNKGKTESYVAIFNDITEKKKAEESILQLAHYDELTKLPNRALFFDRLNHAVERAKRESKNLAVLFLDLDNFKEVNDSRGHSIGDKLLKCVSRRLSRIVRSSDSVARLGGDEFTVILEGIDSHQDAKKEAAAVAVKILIALTKPFIINNESLRVSASVGIAVYPEDALKADDLVRSADMAMYEAKKKGRNTYEFYTPSLKNSYLESMNIRHELLISLENMDFILHYQPRVDMETRKIVGFEALVRWKHPIRGLQLPDIFIPIAEETGIICKLGEWILNEACRQLKEWHDNGHPDLIMSINLSAPQVADKMLPRIIEQYLKRYSLPASSIELELTETAMLQDLMQIQENLEAIEATGTAVSLDDFGIGYSSLSHIKNFPIRVLKIDQSFIAGLEKSDEDRSIVQSCISLAKPLGIKTVAEGVETIHQLAFLEKAGCDFYQGFFCSKPVEAPAAFTLLSSS